MCEADLREKEEIGRRQRRREGGNRRESDDQGGAIGRGVERLPRAAGADAWDKEKADPKGKPQQAPSLPPDLHAVTEANRQAVVSCGCAVSCRVVSETVCHL